MMAVRPVFAQTARGKDGSSLIEPDILLGQDILSFAIQYELMHALSCRVDHGDERAVGDIKSGDHRIFAAVEY